MSEKRKEIETKVDQLLAGQEAGEGDKDFRRTKKLSLKTTSILVAVVLIVAVTTGALMLYFVSQTSDITVQGGQLTWDDVDASQIVTTENFITIPGSTTEYLHTLKLVSSAEDLNVRFTISDTGTESAEGVSMTVYYLDGVNWVELVDETSLTGVLSMVGGDEISIKTTYFVNYYTLPSSDYQYTLTLEDDDFVGY